VGCRRRRLVARDPFDNGISFTAYRYALYICPTEQGGSIEDPQHRDMPKWEFSLHEACDIAVALNSWIRGPRPPPRSLSLRSRSEEIQYRTLD